MTTRIIFNGQEYADRGAMPDDVRKAYDEALAMFRDADANGIPDVFERGVADTVISVQRASVGFTGPTGDGAPPASVTGPPGLAPPGAQDTLQTSIGLLLAFLAGFILVFGVALMFAIGGGRNHLPGRLAVAIAALLLLGWLDTQATRLARRREPLLGPDSQGYRRFVVWSAAGFALAAALLLGVAWFLP